MGVGHTTSAGSSGRGLVIVVAVIAAVAIAGLTYFVLRPSEAPKDAAAPVEPVPVTRPTPRPAPRAEAAPAPEPAPEPAETRPARRRPAARPAAEAPAPAAPAAEAIALTIESDVPGASVFVDREFKGTAPLTLTDLAQGSRRIDLRAEGFEGLSRTVEVGPGAATVTMRFREVRLEASVAVTHKHGMGQCEGTLRATTEGLRYDTTNRNDAFTLPFGQVETFEINYLDKNLRVKQRGGKTWNFTDKQAQNADRLFVFHRDVQAARDKLAKGFTAAK